jgi:two-component system, chemotaxis family, chemotaxis protein CheY
MNQILIVDDEEPVRYALHRVLTAHGFDCHAVDDGRAALSYLLNNTVALVITDIIMPDIEGVELIHRLRRSHPKLPILAISGGGRIDAVEHLKLASALGAAATLRKPFDNDELLATVRRLLPGNPAPAPSGSPIS